MATYYWVGGSGNWDATSTTNWAASSGGGGGAGVPTSADNVIFDTLSNATGYTVTVGTNAVCNDLTAVGPLTGTVTFSLGATAAIDCHGSMTLPASNLTWTGVNNAAIRFKATTTGKTVLTNGVTLTNTNVTFDGVGGGWALSSALTCSTVTVTNGSFDTGNYNVTCTVFNSNNSNTRTVTLGSSTVTCSAAGAWTFTTVTGITFNANTSQINLSATSPVFNGGGLTYHNVSFTSIGINNATVNGANTFNNLTFAARILGIGYINISVDQIVNGTLDIQSANTSLTSRLSPRSNVPGLTRTITAATVSLGTGIDFRDITAAGASSPWDVFAKGSGDCGGNTNITFPAAKIVYRRGTGNFSATQWSDSSGGAAAAQWFPIAQDTMEFDANTTTGTHTVDTNWNLGTLTMTNSTTVTLTIGANGCEFYGDITLSNAVTPSGTTAFFIAGRTTQTVTSSGRTFTQPININNPNGSFKLADALAMASTNTLTFTRGGIDLNNQTLTVGLITSTTSNVKTLAFGTSGKFIITGSGTVWQLAPSNLTITGTAVVDVNNNSATATTVTTGALSEAQSISFNFISGTYTLTDTAAVYRSVNFTGFAGTIPNSVRTIFGGLTLSTGMTLTAGANATTFASTSAGNTITSAGKTQDYPIVFNGIGGAWACQDALTQGSTRAFTITNGTIQLKNGVTSTVGAFTTSGTNQKFLQSTLAGSQATISQASGTVNASYLTIQDINATGGATWNASKILDVKNLGNNSGWNFFPVNLNLVFNSALNKILRPVFGYR